MACAIPANPDVAGVGVRVSLYIQAFITLIPAVLKFAEDLIIELRQKSSPAGAKAVVSPAVKWDDILEVVYPNLILGCAMLVSAGVQTIAYNLTVYHALIVLNLNWITSLAVVPCLIISDNDQKGSKFPNLDFKKMGLFHIAHLTLTGAFGLWLFVDTNRYDKDETLDCTSTTTYFVFGKHVLANNPAFRRFWLAIYSMLAVPFLNLIVVAIVFGVLALIGVCGVFPLAMIPISIICYGQSGKVFESLGRLIVPIGFFFPVIIMVVFNEITISSNNVAEGEGQWTLGQTLALFVALPPLLSVASQTYETLRNIQRIIRETDGLEVENDGGGEMNELVPLATVKHL